MNNILQNIIKENNIHPISYIKKSNIYIVSDNMHSYVIKMNTNNYDIYKYLISRDFLNFPENFNKKSGNYDISLYIEDVKTKDIQKINDLINILSILHYKTMYERKINRSDIDDLYNKINDNIIEVKDYYYHLNDHLTTHILLYMYYS